MTSRRKTTSLRRFKTGFLVALVLLFLAMVLVPPLLSMFR